MKASILLVALAAPLTFLYTSFKNVLLYQCILDLV